jgi:hypothetical protein
MSDELFPSGPWVGFYTYQPHDRHRMDLHLVFGGGRMSGDGNDDVGRFLIRGRYDAASRECHWTKSYVGRHDVYYTGYREGKGIWGRWEINAFNHGGFHIWPRAAGEGDGDTQAEAASPPARLPQAVETGEPTVVEIPATR